MVLLLVLLPILLPLKVEIGVTLCRLPVFQRLIPGVMLDPVGVHCRLGWLPVGVLKGSSRPAVAIKQ